MIIFSLLVLDNVDFFEVILVILFLELDVVLEVVEVFVFLLGRRFSGAGGGESDAVSGSDMGKEADAVGSCSGGEGVASGGGDVTALDRLGATSPHRSSQASRPP